MRHAIRHSTWYFPFSSLYSLYLVLMDLVLAHLVVSHPIPAYLVLALILEVFLFDEVPTSGLPF